MEFSIGYREQTPLYVSLGICKHVGEFAMYKGLVTNYGEGGSTKRGEGGPCEVLLLQKGGGGKVLPMLKGGGGGTKCFWLVFMW